MAYTTINKSKDYFNTKLYSGNGSTQTITGVGFQPDMVWTKARSGTSATENHNLYDAVRGATKFLIPNGTSAEGTDANSLTSFASDGFGVGTRTDINGANTELASWNWKANGAGSANTDGSINSTVSVNTTAGFSIVKYVGTGSGSNSTVGHGLGVKPDMIIVKNLAGTTDWVCWHKDLASETNSYIRFNSNAVVGSTTNYWNSSAPTNQVFGVSPDGYNNNKNGENTIAYCFAGKTGYSKFGAYTGNFNNSGTFIYTGFKPSWVIVKKRDDTGNWRMFDSVRAGGINPANKWLNADASTAEGTDVQADLLSNGIKLRDAANAFNTSGSIYIYMAFGQSLVGSNNVCATAR